MPKRQNKTKNLEIKKEKDFSEVLADELRIEKEKKLIMWAGVTFFMVLIGGLWLTSFTREVRLVVANSDNDTKTISNLISDISGNAENLNKQLELIKDLASSTVDLAESRQSSTTIEMTTTTPAIIEELKTVLENDIIASTSEAKLPVLE